MAFVTISMVAFRLAHYDTRKHVDLQLVKYDDKLNVLKVLYLWICTYYLPRVCELFTTFQRDILHITLLLLLLLLLLLQQQ